MESLNLLIFVAIFATFYFFMIRPQVKKQKEQQKFQDAVEKGDEVVTASGIIGKIQKIEDQIIHLAIDSKTVIRVTKSSISKEMTDSLHGSASQSK
jgi:preprotein translocase subunit YajC